MNIRLKKYKKNRLKGMNQYNSARAAGYSETYARTHNDRIERSIKGDMVDLLEQVGLTDKFLASYLKKGLNAKKLYGKKGIKYADWGARHRFIETVLKMAGKLKVEDDGDRGLKILPNITFIVNTGKVGETGVRNPAKDGDRVLHSTESIEGNRIAGQI